ncbi:hypothetical protein, partial [Priestia megaterium]|uniref:hypothetical protein n=1 Tax=Priestia megaterium TaxID=1404 RepID=UPI002FFEE14A
YIIHQLIEKDRKPFLLNNADVNIEKDTSHHRIRFTRTDGKELEALFTPGSILPIVSLLNRATKSTIEQGIFSLNSEHIEEYLSSSSQLVDVLIKMKEMYTEAKVR